MSLSKPKGECAASELQCPAAGAEVHLPRGGIYE